MTESEVAELLQHIRRLLVTIGMPDLAERAAETSEPGDSVQAQTLAFLDALEVELRLGGSETVRTLINRLNETVKTENNEPIRGVEVELSALDRRLYGADRIELGGSARVQELADELRAFREEVRTSFVEDGWV
jgi:hypothetical protein